MKIKKEPPNANKEVPTNALSINKKNALSAVNNKFTLTSKIIIKIKNGIVN